MTATAGSDGAAIEAGGLDQADWTDPKRYSWMWGMSVPLIPFGAFALYSLTGWGISWWYGPILIFMIFPIVDWLGGIDDSNPPDWILKALEEDKYYRYITYAFVPIQFASFIWACWMWAYGDLSTLDSVGLALTVSMVSGIAIAVAHELGHKKEKLERWLAKISLAQTFYGHFFIEHNRGHHVRVSTPEDPASSRMGENFYEFWPRTVFGSLRSAWRLESARFERLGKSKWSIKNDLLNAWLMSIVLFAAVILIFGVEILPFVAIQAFFGFSLLEVVNYVEHYGLGRQRSDDGRYERVRPAHSWNSNNTWSNVGLYHLQRHSDHHAHPTRRYQALCDMEDAPVLPTGYAGMIVFALVPPVWNRVMDKRLMAHYDGDITRANIHPRARKRIMKRYGVTPAATTAGGTA